MTEETPAAIADAFPIAVSDQFKLEPNASFFLRDWQMVFKSEGSGDTIQVEGEIELAFVPMPYIKFRLRTQKPLDFFAAFRLSPRGELLTDNDSLKAVVASLNGNTITGYIESTEVGSPHDLQYVQFLI